MFKEKHFKKTFKEKSRKNLSHNFIILLGFVLTSILMPCSFAATIKGTIYDLSLEPINAFIEINTTPKQFIVAVNGEYEIKANHGKYIMFVKTYNGYSAEEIEIIDDGEYQLDIVVGLNIDEPMIIDEQELSEKDYDYFIETKENSRKSFFDFNANLKILGIILFVMLLFLVIFFIKSTLKLDINNFSKEKFSEKNKKAINNKLIKNMNKEQDIKNTKSYKDSFSNKNNVFSGVSENEKKEDTDLVSRILNLIKDNERMTQKDIRKSIPYSEAKISLILTQLENEGKIKKIKKGRGNIIIYLKD
ncbi:MAG: winged helix-turn-helix transcriptional regulator [Candidatus Woesearchaeota archaeon]